MLLNNSHGVILDFGSMTPSSITMTTRSEAQQWQVKYQKLNPNLSIYSMLRIGQRKIVVFNVSNLLLFCINVML
jgi:hypothetical protein